MKYCSILHGRVCVMRYRYKLQNRNNILFMIVRFIYTLFTNIFDPKMQNALYIYKIYTSKDGFTLGAVLCLD